MNAENFNFSEKGLEEVYKKVMLLMYNVANFYLEYKKEEDKEFKESDDIMDLWILSRTEELRRTVENHMEKYDLIKTCNEIKRYIDDLSTWYVRNTRDRFNEEDGYAAKTLRYVLEKFVKIIAPIMPFVAEKIYQGINNGGSVHLESYPIKDKFENSNINVKMEKLREQVSAALKIRDQNQVGIKWPLAKAKISNNDYSEEYLEIFKREVNVKEVELVNERNFVELDLKMTKELECEGFAREICRKIQATRKKLGMTKNDRVEIAINLEMKDFLSSNIELIKERVGASKIAFKEDSSKYDYSEEGKIREKNYSFKLKKL
jgi:isoleucyl-tRNA synthetase